MEQIQESLQCLHSKVAENLLNEIKGKYVMKVRFAKKLAMEAFEEVMAIENDDDIAIEIHNKVFQEAIDHLLSF
ncbi:MAG: hypothetical protein AB1656_02525 [Candidatus Omnitrophota bacterium]